MFGMLFFALSKLLQDVIISPHSYGHGRILYPSIVAILSVVIYNQRIKLKSITIASATFVLLSIWGISTVAALVDTLLNLDFWHQLTSSWNSSIALFASILFQPWLILTPAVGLTIVIFLNWLRNLLFNKFGPK